MSLNTALAPYYWLVSIRQKECVRVVKWRQGVQGDDRLLLGLCGSHWRGDIRSQSRGFTTIHVGVNCRLLLLTGLFKASTSLTLVIPSKPDTWHRSNMRKPFLHMQNLIGDAFQSCILIWMHEGCDPELKTYNRQMLETVGDACSDVDGGPVGHLL